MVKLMEETMVVNGSKILSCSNLLRRILNHPWYYHMRCASGWITNIDVGAVRVDGLIHDALLDHIGLDCVCLIQQFISTTMTCDDLTSMLYDENAILSSILSLINPMFEIHRMIDEEGMSSVVRTVYVRRMDMNIRLSLYR